MSNVKYRFSDSVITFIFILVFIITVVLGTILFPPTLVRATEQNVSQACGMSGIILRADGSVIVDGWKDYSASRIAAPADINPVITAKNMPSAIHLGKNLTDGTPICMESSMGSHCITLEQLRKVK